jgi:hypothetical protein
MNNLKLELSIDDINLILESLGQQPFARVFQLIGRIQEQARAQVEAAQQQIDGRGAKNE